ncbi:MAG: SpoIID/LytB domain-containing protein [Blastocatellia bacterium]|nr:SpoIID/LytB domain-containing protein [Blastocatellia bacterium]
MRVSQEKIDREPRVSVGLLTGVRRVSFDLKGPFGAADGALFHTGSYIAMVGPGRIEIDGSSGKCFAPEFYLAPVDPESTFVIHDVLIGIDFHWERKEAEKFQGNLSLKLDATAASLIVINETSIESYLNSVISSEMSACAHPELLKAHSIISRSWLLAQLKEGKPERSASQQLMQAGAARELIRWYDRENHAEFDVCADDHCQRYHGIAQAASPLVSEAVQSTHGQVLTYEGMLCDTRYSKSCGGMTESYAAAWGDEEVPYLPVIYDGESFPSGYDLPLRDEANAAAWIRNSPPAYCNTKDRRILEKILPDFDQETADFYRWRVVLKQEELGELLRKKLGVDFGAILSLIPVERGGSGRIVRLRIAGERETMIVGKELEIRRALSPSHLYSSAFVAEADDRPASRFPSQFTLIGAGWGHGVGLCQIGAALMAERGYNYRQILAHYYRGAELQAHY